MKQILDVGQCNADHSRISSVLKQHFEVELHRGHLHEDSVSLTSERKFDLVLINRLLDQDGSEGMKVLETLKQSDSTSDIPVMIVSNYADAQQAAVAAGAVQGFGKAKLNTPETLELLGQYLK